MAKPVTKARKRAAPKSAAAAPVSIRRVSPLDGIIRLGRHGADTGNGPGVRLSLRHPVSIATVIARKGKLRALSTALKKHYGFEAPAPGRSASARQVSIHWCGPEQWYIVSNKHGEGELFAELAANLARFASVSDQSHGRIIIAMSGRNVRDLLAKGTPVDLHPREFGPGQCAVTQMAHVGVHIAQKAKDSFEVSLFRGFAESFWEWLTEMSQEFGYEVT